MSNEKTADRWAHRTAAWLPRLADAATVDEAADALKAIDFEAVGHDDGPGRHPNERALPRYRRAIERLDDVDALVASWMDRFFETLDAGEAWHATLAGMRARGEDGLPPFDSSRVYTGQRLRSALRAAGPRLGPHVGRLTARLLASQADVEDEPRRTAQRDTADALLDVLADAGPFVVGARPAILSELRGRGVCRWPSSLLRAVGRLAELDPGFVGEVRKLLAGPETRPAAMEALAAIGVPAGDATPELLAFRASDDATTRYLSLYALSRMGPPTPDVLDAFEAAFDDASVDVRMAVTIALREHRPEPTRFVPRVMAMCDEREHVHDFDVREEAVKTLAAYGPAAVDALPRLTAFLAGPIDGRTVKPEAVARAIEAIAGRPSVEVVGPAYEPARRSSPIADDEPLWPVTFRDRLAYVDARGEVALVTPFAHGGRFDGGRAIVKDDEYAAHVIDRRGAVVFRSEWDAIEPFREARAAVKRGERWGFVDADGRVIVEPQYDSVTAFGEGLAGVQLGRVRGDEEQGIQRQDGRRGYIDASGRVVIPIEIERDAYSFGEGLAPICTGGEMRQSAWDESRQSFMPTQYGFIDHTGRRVIDGCCDMPTWFREGLAPVSRGAWVNRERHGYIDRDGRVVIPLEFTDAHQFRDGLAVVRRRGRARRDETLVIDPRGNVVWSTRAQHVGALNLGLFQIYDGNAYGIVDRTGTPVVGPQFDRILPFIDGLAEVERGAWYGLIDPTGRMVFGPVTGGRTLGILGSDWTS